MRRTFSNSWIDWLPGRYSKWFLIVSLTGYLYIIIHQLVWTIPVKEFNVNFESNRSKRRTLFVYLEGDNNNHTLKSQSTYLNRKNRRIKITRHHDERSILDYNSSIVIHKKPMWLNSQIQSTRNPARKAKRLPQVIIIGVKKCGTRALLEYLRLHPDIKAPGPEPHFFDRNFQQGLDWYRERMPLTTKHQITIEKTPRYFVSVEVPRRVWNMSKSIKLIIVLRNPVTRAISDFTQGASKRNYLYQSVFVRKAIRGNGTGDVNRHWSVINTGLYSQHIQRWLQYFPLNQMFFVSGESLISNPAKEIEGVQSFLGIKHVITSKNFYFNATKGFPCLLKDTQRTSPRCFNSSKGRKHLHLDKKVLEKLKTFYEPYNKRFYSLTGRYFGW